MVVEKKAEIVPCRSCCVDRVKGRAQIRLTVATKRLNGFFREIELLENRIFNPPRTIYFN